MQQWEHTTVTIEVSADDIRGKETQAVLNEYGRDGWEPWHMFTSAACGAYRIEGASTGKIWVCVWLKRPVSSM